MFVPSCYFGCGLSSELKVTTHKDAFSIYINNCCYCKLKFFLNHHTITGGEFHIGVKLDPSEPAIIQVVENSTLGFIFGEPNVYSSYCHPSYLRTGIDLDVYGISEIADFIYEEKEIPYAKLSMKSKEALRILLKLSLIHI